MHVDALRTPRDPERMPVTQRSPRVLVADDDTISQQFFAAALAEMGCNVVIAENGARALAVIGEHTFDLLVLDCRMPDFGGTRLLAELRRRNVHTTAIATSAEIDPPHVEKLRSAGFADVIGKPLTLVELQRRLKPCLAGSATAAPRHGSGESTAGVLDDNLAVKASGNAKIVRSLRKLFAQELEALQAEPDQLLGANDVTVVRERLHRLRASCGFCGATALTDAIVRFDGSLRDQGEVTETARERLIQACRQTLVALRAQS